MIIEAIKMKRCTFTEDEIDLLKKAAKLLDDIDDLDTTNGCWADFENDATTYLGGWCDAVDFLNELVDFIEEERGGALIFEEEV